MSDNKPLYPATGSAHPWHARPRWQKRIHGWLCYQLSAWAALVWPEAVDRSMYATLKEQFEPNRELTDAAKGDSNG